MMLTMNSSSREAQFLASYDPRRYVPVAVTVDVAALTIGEGKLNVLVVQRANPPETGKWCLPGGFLKPDDGGAFPDLVNAAMWRLAIETGLDASSSDAAEALKRVHLEQVASYGTPGRDPRMHVVSTAYLAFAPDLPDPVAGVGAIDARWMPIDEALELKMAFDHNKILANAIERARSKLEYTTLAAAFLPKSFTIPQLQEIYEIVWGEKLTSQIFRRKVLSTPGFVEAVGEVTNRGGKGGGRRAALYRAGKQTLLHPAIERSATTRKRLGAAV